MGTEVIMPVLDMTSEEMTIVRWMKRDGEPIKKGEPLLEVMTEKITIEIDAPADGIVRGIRFEADAVVPVGEVIAYIVGEGEAWEDDGGASGGTEAPASAPAATVDIAASASAAATDTAAASPAASADVSSGSPQAEHSEPTAAEEPKHVTGVPRLVRAAPIVRRIAADLQVDLQYVTGTGPGGRVLADDVRAFAERAAQAASARAGAGPAAGAVTAMADAVVGSQSGSPSQFVAAATPLSPVRQVIGRRMQQSWRDAPHVTLTMDVDMAAAAAFRAQLREALAAEGSAVSLTWNSLIAWFTVQALVRRPDLNATLENDILHSHADINLGVAVDTPRGLLVPVVHGAQRLRPGQLAEALAEAAAKAAAGTLQPAKMSGGTFTITNLGGFGIGAFTPIINPPQIAILGVGAVKDTIVPVDGAPAVRPMCTFSLSFDHRAIDGADGARFLAELRDMLQQPHRLIV